MCRNSGCTGRSALYYYMYYNGFPLPFKALFAFLCHFFAISLASAGNHAFVPPYHPDTDTAGCKSRLAAIKTVKKERPHSLKGCKDILFGADEGI